jgi:tetratricopeptide (TPR) repeat protein
VILGFFARSCPNRGLLARELLGKGVMPRSSAEPADPALALRKRAARLLHKKEPRKAVLALREAAALDPSGQSFVRLAHVLLLTGKAGEALHWLKQALYSFRHDEQRGRGRTVARLILKLDPSDASALRRAA